MKAYRVIFPFSTTTEIPHDINLRLDNHKFEPLKDGQTKTAGFALLTESDRFINSDGRHLFHYAEQTRKADANTVRHILQERTKQVTDDGREVTPETLEALKEQAQREAEKFASIKQSGVYVLYDAPAGRVWCAGSTAKKCEAALKRLRRVLGSLDTESLFYDRAGHQLARIMSGGTLRLNETLRIPYFAKVTATDLDKNSRVVIDGLDLRDESVGDVLSDLVVRSTELELIKHLPDNEYRVLAFFSLDVPESGALSLRALDFDGGETGNEDSEHNHAADMQIVAKTCQAIAAGLDNVFRGTGA